MVTFCVCFLFFFFLYFSKRHKSTKGEHRNINAGLNGLQPRTRWVKGGIFFFFGGQGTPDDTQINPPPRESNKQQITQKALMRVWWIHTIPYSP